MNRLREAFKKMICLRETKECRKGQHWLGLQKLLTFCFEPIKGLCTGIGPIRRLEASIWSLFVLAIFVL